MVKILLSNLGCTKNMGIIMMIKALVSSIDADFYSHQLTLCRNYEKYGIKYSWKPFGFDFALDLGGDTFTLYYGRFQFLRHCFHLLIHVVFRQKFIFLAQTFGYYGAFTGIAKFFFRRAEWISVREKSSFLLLKSMGIHSYLTADITFLLDSWSSSSYIGGSYHRIIAAEISGCSGVWDGSRAENFKFEIFSEQLNLSEMKKRAEINVRLLERLLSD